MVDLEDSSCSDMSSDDEGRSRRLLALSVTNCDTWLQVIENQNLIAKIICYVCELFYYESL